MYDTDVLLFRAIGACFNHGAAACVVAGSRFYRTPLAACWAVACTKPAELLLAHNDFCFVRRQSALYGSGIMEVGSRFLGCLDAPIDPSRRIAVRDLYRRQLLLELVDWLPSSPQGWAKVAAAVGVAALLAWGASRWAASRQK